MDRTVDVPYAASMLRLTILRHAKSSWATPGTGDIDRPLNERGRQQAVALAAWVKRERFEVDEVLCSPARRTRETSEIVWSDLPTSIVEPLYSGHLQTYLDALAGREGRHIVIVGHNPTCDEIVRALSTSHGEPASRLADRHYGTANLATVAFAQDDWTSIANARGTLELYVTAQDLRDVPTTSRAAG